MAQLGSIDAENTHAKVTVAKAKYTCMEQQVVELKLAHPRVLLAVECGYRYRFFGDDAVTAAATLGIVAHPEHNFMVASVPVHRIGVHLRRLVNAGLKVGIVRQSETAALKAAGLTASGKSGTFERELVGVYTAATLVEDSIEALGIREGGRADRKGGFGPDAMAMEEADDSDDDTSSASLPALEEQWLACLVEIASDKRNAAKRTTIGLVAVDVKAGRLVYDMFEDNSQRNELETRLRSLLPREFVLPAREARDGHDGSPREGNVELSGLTEASLGAYGAAAVDSFGNKIVGRVERLSWQDFDPDNARTILGLVQPGSQVPGSSPDANMATLDLPHPCGVAAGGLLKHLSTRGIRFAATAAPQIDAGRGLVIETWSSTTMMNLCGQTLHDLEVSFIPQLLAQSVPS